MKAKNTIHSVVEMGSRLLVDAETVGRQFDFSAQYINRLARMDKIPWHGIKNGVKVYRRFDPEEVRAALAHIPREPQRAEIGPAERRAG